MDPLFLVRVVAAFALVAAMLVGMTWIVRSLARGRLVVAAERRLVTVVESTVLTQHAGVHVVKVADRYYLLGGGSAGVSLISELPAEQVGGYLDEQRRRFGEQREAVLRLVERVRRRA